MDENNRNFLLAIVLSIAVLIVWQFFYASPKMKEEQARKQQQTEQTQQAPSPGVPQPSTAEGPPRPGRADAPPATSPVPAGAGRKAALAASPRVAIETPALEGSVALKGARIDDLVLKDYRRTTRPGAENVVLFSPAGAPAPFYAEHGWTGDGGVTIKLPGRDTLWQQKGSGALTPGSPLTLEWDNGEGLLFRRVITVDEHYLFSIRQEVENRTGNPVTLYPYALISRHGEPEIQSFYILHEGLVGVLGERGLQEIDYDDILEDKVTSFKDVTGGWLGITDKYWAAVVIPDQRNVYQGRFTGSVKAARSIYQTDYLLGATAVPAGGKAAADGLLFAGAKEVHLVDGYAEKHGIRQFDLLIDWGWFYFLTKPLFFALDYFFRLVGNFGVSILIVTVLIKLLLFPLANKSYVSMSKMKKLAPEMNRIKERYADDKARQQQALMDLYKKEKVNPASGCLPILIQIPVFFALYKVLFVTIEMRHAPFYGWIRDLSAPDPTTIFNLFGLIPWDPPGILMIGIWPLIMGVSMWLQMQLNPAPPDPIQAKIFQWMPVIFTFLLAPFPAGLVIYWAWNNVLSILQQWYIMSRQGVQPAFIEKLATNKKNRRGKD